MPAAKVLRLDDYRGRRLQRIQLSEALYGADAQRGAVFGHLTEVADLCGADRAATVWVDEYGSGLVHAHVVVDLANDAPRRHFSDTPLRRAWELGVPGALDAIAEPGGSVPTTFAISLGSDGMRAWFLVAESIAPRPLLDGATRDRLMFLAGECAALLLHRELDALVTDAGSASAEEASFPGWGILRDMDGREEDEAVSKRIAQRFLVGRLARMLIDEDLAIAEERRRSHVRTARSEIGDFEGSRGREEELWVRALDAIERDDLYDTADALFELGKAVEEQGHTNGALEFYSASYEIAASIGAARSAAEAARHRGNILTRLADWDEARENFDRARIVAELSGERDVVARSLVGAAVLAQTRGNLPAARVGLAEALDVAEASGHRDSIGMAHHAWLGLEQWAGEVEKGLEHGWLAVATYESEDRRIRGMASLGAALLEYGDHQAAEDAWAWVAHKSGDQYYLIYAHDALSHLHALKGDRGGFETHARRCDDLGWERGDLASVKAEILYYRGLSHRALGDTERAAEWLERAVGFAEVNGFNRTMFLAEDALRALRERRARAEDFVTAAPAEVREGLRTMRHELVGAAAD